MGLNANNQKGTGGNNFVEQEALPVKAYPVRVVQVIDLGLQPQRPYNGKAKPPVDQIHLTYEFSNQFMKDEAGDDRLDMPRWLSETLTFYSLEAEKAKSTLRYNAIDPQGITGGEFTELAGMSCQLTPTVEPKKDKKKNNKVVEGKFVNYVGDVAGAVDPDIYKQPELVNEARIFLLEDPDLEVFNTFPEWLQDKIKGNLNYNGSVLQKLLGEEKQPEEEPEGNAEPPAPKAPKAPPTPDVPQ